MRLRSFAVGGLLGAGLSLLVGLTTVEVALGTGLVWFAIYLYTWLRP